MSKRSIQSFFSPPVKKAKSTVETLSRRVSPPPTTRSSDAQLKEDEQTNLCKSATYHAAYPCPIPDLPEDICNTLQELLGVTEGKVINNQPHLDLLYFQPLIPEPTATSLFHFLRSGLPFYRVCYTINRFGKSTNINTPRYTTVFGLDETSRFHTTLSSTTDAEDQTLNTLTTKIVETSDPSKIVPPKKYKCAPRPIPTCLTLLKNLTEALTGDTYNFILINYYATGTDSISYHSDDERFLGHNPSIASFTLGAKRDFLMKHKPAEKPGDINDVDSTPIKLPLGSGDMILMRGETQSRWLHSIPKRKGGEADKGRINITMRKAMVPGGTENYYRYNVGDGPVYKWDTQAKEMRLWQPAKDK